VKAAGELRASAPVHMCTQHLTSGHSNLLRINCRAAPRSLVHYMWLALMHVAWRCARAGVRGGAGRCETLTFDMCVLERARWESCLSPRRGPDQPPAGRARQPLPRRPRAPAAAGGLREAMRVLNGRWALGANSSMPVKTCTQQLTLLTFAEDGAIQCCPFPHPARSIAWSIARRSRPSSSFLGFSGGIIVIPPPRPR
jgi:hypothetical protein